MPDGLRPRVAPGSLTIGIVHVGLGAFHRAHQAVYTEDAMALSRDRQWAICGVSPRGSASAQALAKQNGLYTLLERGASVNARVIGSIREVLSASHQRAAVIDRISQRATQILTLTVTEAGYLAVPGVMGLICDALLARAAAGAGPITILCCDNIPHNGDYVRERLLERTASDSQLSRWLEQSVTFPSCVVDRIVPASGPGDRADAAALIGVTDECPVTCEPYTQWVIEDVFAAERPAWEQAGVAFVTDVSRYQLVKLRMLNGAHSALAYLGALSGYEMIADAVADAALRSIVFRMLTEEVAPTLDAPPDLALDEYAESALVRFANRALGHRCTQVASDGSQKLPIRLLPTIACRLARGEPASFSLLAVAAWMRYVSARRTDGGQPLDLRDPLAHRIAERVEGVKGAKAIALRLLTIEEVFGPALVEHRVVVDQCARWLEQLISQGASATIASALSAVD